MGRYPIPDEIKKARGTAQPCRTNPDKPDFTRVIDAGEPPEILGSYGKSVFNLVTTELINANILQTTDIDLVVLLCTQYDDYYESMADLKKSGKYMMDMNGNKKLHPAWKIKTLSSARIIQICGHLGLSPVARQRLKMIKADQGKKKSTAGKMIKMAG